MMSPKLLLNVLTIACAGCGPADDRSAKEAPPQETVFDDTVAAKRRVQVEAEKTAAERKEKLDQALEKTAGEQ
jgi:hypothetical protein